MSVPRPKVLLELIVTEILVWGIFPELSCSSPVCQSQAWEAQGGTACSPRALSPGQAVSQSCWQPLSRGGADAQKGQGVTNLQWHKKVMLLLCLGLHSSNFQHVSAVN